MGSRLEAGSTLLVLDLAAVEFVDSTGLLGDPLGVPPPPPRRGRPGARGCRKPVVELIQLTRLDRVLRLFANADEAVAALAQA